MTQFRVRAPAKRLLLRLFAAVVGQAGPELLFYVPACSKVLRGALPRAAFAAATAMHALGHALLALAAGALALVWSGGALLDVPRDRSDTALVVCLVGLFATAVKAVGGSYASFVQAKVSAEVGATLRRQVLDGLFELRRAPQVRHADQGDMQRYDDVTVAGVAALTDRVREVEAGLNQGVLGAVRAISQLVPLTVLAVGLAPHLAMAALLAYATFFLLLAHLRRAWKRAGLRTLANTDALLGVSDEAVRHADLWITYGAENVAHESLSSLGKAVGKGRARVEAAAIALGSLNEILGTVAVLLALLAARSPWIGPPQRLLPFAVVFFLAYKPIRELSDARLALARSTVAFEQLAPLLRHHDPPPQNPPPRWPLAPLDAVGLRLAHGHLPPLSFHIPAGQLVALVGPTGLGKTTLLRSLLGLEPLLDGTLTFGDHVLTQVPAGPLHRPFAWVPQDAPLLADTLKANITLGAPGIDPRAILDTLGVSALFDRIGHGPLLRPLSGGERQLVALARALATDLPVLLLDEPTHGLDRATQAQVLAAIGRLRGKRTVLLVTHRPEPQALADIVLDLKIA
ncbi:MAG: ATP-binding cassette domain-containing protein [Myxococcales bacterium]